ncbi:hypothetical protein Vretifemale_3356, partial [Volvox reticuliferus]
PGASNEVDADVSAGLSLQRTDDAQGIQRAQVPRGGPGRPTRRDSSGCAIAPSRGCEQDLEHSQTAKTSDKWKHKEAGNWVQGLSASFPFMDDEEPDHPALQERGVGNRDAAAAGGRRGPSRSPGEDMDGQDARWQCAAMAEDISVGLATTMRSTSAS